MSEEVITQVLRHYGVRPARVLETQKGYRNESHPAVLQDGSKVNLIIYKSEPGIIERIQRANAVADYVGTQGLPARRTVDRRTIQLSNGNHKKYGALYSYLSGSTIPWEAYTQEHVKLLGKTMSDMHAALKNMPHANLLSVEDEYIAITERMQRYFADQNVQRAMHEKLGVHIDASVFNSLLRMMTACRQLPNRQPLHMDFVRGNLLFNSSRGALQITGILDFEKTAVGHPLFDIARTLAFLLVDCKYKAAVKVYKYFIHSGYNKRGKAGFKITAHNEQLLHRLTNLFLVYDFYKFLRHNPYDSLTLNNHFVRTKHILVNSAMLQGDDRIEYKK